MVQSVHSSELHSAILPCVTRVHSGLACPEADNSGDHLSRFGRSQKSITRRLPLYNFTPNSSHVTTDPFVIAMCPMIEVSAPVAPTVISAGLAAPFVMQS